MPLMVWIIFEMFFTIVTRWLGWGWWVCFNFFGISFCFELSLCSCSFYCFRIGLTLCSSCSYFCTFSCLLSSLINLRGVWCWFTFLIC